MLIGVPPTMFHSNLAGSPRGGTEGYMQSRIFPPPALVIVPVPELSLILRSRLIVMVTVLTISLSGNPNDCTDIDVILPVVASSMSEHGAGVRQVDSGQHETGWRRAQLLMPAAPPAGAS